MRIISENSYLTDKELVAKYKKLAAQADKRIERIEAKMGQAKYKGIEKFAYTEAKHKLKNIIGLSNGRPRFDRSIKKLSRGQKELMVGHVEHFLASKSSSLREYNKSWKQGLAEYNRNNRKDLRPLTMDEYRELWESEEFRKLVEEFGSDEAIAEFNTFFDGNISMTDAIEMALINKSLKSFANNFNENIKQKREAGKHIDIQDRLIYLEESDDGLKAKINQGKKVDLRNITVEEVEKWVNDHPDAFNYNLNGISIKRKIK